jgi:hypothetical protein
MAMKLSNFDNLKALLKNTKS